MLGLLLPSSHGFSAARPPPASLYASAAAPAATAAMAAGDTRQGRGEGQAALKERRLTKALFWTERYLDQEGRWLGRVQTAEPSSLRTPCAAARSPPPKLPLPSLDSPPAPVRGLRLACAPCAV